MRLQFRIFGWVIEYLPLWHDCCRNIFQYLIPEMMLAYITNRVANNL